MRFLPDTDVITIMERTLNLIDPRLLNHGRRVAYIVYQLLWPTGRYDRREIRDICIGALLHDIGAYKTEEIDRMVSFETEDTWDHSIYGYLFLNHFSPIKHLALSILEHHTPCTQLDRENPAWEMAQIYFIADRLDIYAQSGIVERPLLYGLLQKQRGVLFHGDIVDFVLQSDISLPVTDEDVPNGSKIDQVLHGIPLTDEEVDAYLTMIVLFIDFRSHHTLSHTIATTCISDHLASLMNVSDSDRKVLVTGSWLHDIGKTGIPLKILEKPGRLTDEEMATIQQHVTLTNRILQDCVSDQVRLVAAHHHEKLDGSGYPHGLHASELTICERISVVSDIFSALCGVRSYKTSFPKEKVVSILTDMKKQGLLDPDVVETAVANYDRLIAAVGQQVRPFEESFEMISNEFDRLQRERNR